MKKLCALILMVAIAGFNVKSSHSTSYWAKTYGGDYYEVARSIQQTTDGGYIVAGETYSFGAGDYDFWVLRLDAGGNVTWQKTYGVTGND